MYISRVDQQRRSYKGAESLYQVFKVVLFMCQDLIIKENVVKLRSVSVECFRQVFEGTILDMKGFGLGCVYFMCGLSEMEFLGCVVFSSNVLNLRILYRLS